MKLEAEEEKIFEGMAFNLGCKAIKFIDPGSRNAPDRIVFCPNGRTLFLEFKRGKEKPRKGQISYHKGLISLGYKVYVVYNAIEAEYILKEFLNEVY